MPYNGTGTFLHTNGEFTGTTVWQQDAAAGINITSLRHDNSDNDIADGLTNCVTRDGQSPALANLPMGNFRHTGVGNAVARTDYAAAGQVQDGALSWGGTATGTGDAIVVALTPAITAPVLGQQVRFIASAQNTVTNPTFTAGGSAATVTDSNGSALTVPFFLVGGVYTLTWNGTNWLAAGSANAITQGLHTFYFSAGGMISRTTNGPAVGRAETSTNKVMVVSLDFDQSTAEYAQVQVGMPKSWNAGTVTAQFGWTASSGTGNVVWGIQALALSDGDALDTAFGTAQTVTDSLIATNDLMVSAVTNAITIGNAPAKSDWVTFQIYRDAASGSDTLNADALLLWVKVFLTINAATDA